METLPPSSPSDVAQVQPLARVLFASRWLQLPLYLGLILTLGVFVVHFCMELVNLLGATLGNAQALERLLQSEAIQELATPDTAHLTETMLMLVALSLIDVVMIANLLLMVIVGGYETFVSRSRLDAHPDHPEWLSGVNASVLKVKLALAIIGISSIHLLRTFIAIDTTSVTAIVGQIAIHITLLLSALAIAWIGRTNH